MIRARFCFPILISTALLISSPAWSANSQESFTVTFVADDYEFRGPDRILPGLTAIEILNQGQELHHAQLVRLPPGKTLADFTAEVSVAPHKLPAWIAYAGGPNAVTPGAKATAIVNLQDGDYLLLCLIPTQTGAPHLALGMIKPLQVRGSATKEVVEPGTNVTITLLDFGFGMTQPISSGMQAIHVTNHGKQPHEVVLVQLAPNKSIADFGSFAEKPAGMPPGKPIGGMVGLDNGGQGSFLTTIEPGKYGLICFFPDENGAPHYRRGMLSEFTVE